MVKTFSYAATDSLIFTFKYVAPLVQELRGSYYITIIQDLQVYKL